MTPPRPLTIRNLTSSPVHVTHSAHFPLPKPSAFASNITSLLGRSRNHHQPSAAQLAEHANGYEEHAVDLTVPAYAAATAPDGVHLRPDATLRLEFSTHGAQKFRVDLVSPDANSSSSSSDGAAVVVEVAVPPLGDVGNTRLTGILHRGRAHLALVSTAILASWMSALPDAVQLGALSMPGTHNSPTHHRALPSVRCQAVGVKAQLENGIRFLDVRVQADRDDDAGGDLALVHGAFPISLGGRKPLLHMLGHVYDFLDAHPSETVVVSLKREGRGDATDESFSTLVQRHVVAPAAAKWYTSPDLPTLGAARGKCVLFRRYNLDASLRAENGGRGVGFDAARWAYNTPNDTTSAGRLCVQDFCEVLETENIERKIEYVKAHLERSAAGLAKAVDEHAPCPLYLNFLSASNFWKVGCWPDRIAAKINPVVVEWLACDHRVDRGRGDTGVVVCDFVGDGGDWTLCRLIVGMNGGLLVAQ